MCPSRAKQSIFRERIPKKTSRKLKELLEAQVAREEHGQAWIAAGQRSWIYLAEGGQVQGGWDVNPGKMNGVRPEYTGYSIFFLIAA